MRQLFVFLALLGAGPAGAQGPAAVAVTQSSTPRGPWYQPTHLVLQTAGGMGVVAAGAGYTALHDRLEAEILLDYVPKKYAGSALGIATIKLLYTPYTVRLNEKFQLRPLTIGVYGSYTRGVINDGEPDQYPEGYYWFSRNTRVGPLLGGRLTYQPATTPRLRWPRRLSAYYELGTNDLYLVGYFSNANYKALSPLDILTLGLGVKLDL